MNTDLERLESKESFKMCLEQVGRLKSEVSPALSSE